MRKIAIIFWEDYLAIAPTIISLCNSYTEKGYKVDVFTTNLNPRYPEIKFNNNIEIHEIFKNTKNPESSIIVKWVNLLFSKINIPITLLHLLKNIYKSLQDYNSLIKRQKFKLFLQSYISPIKYEICIVTDATGFSILKIDNYPKGFLIFLSLEIEYIKTINPFFYPFRYNCTKILNMNLCKISEIIIQDKPRLHELINETNSNIDQFNIYLIPNTFPPANNLQKTNYLQNKFKINNYIILHIG